jgi:hypothetical protein
VGDDDRYDELIREKIEKLEDKVDGLVAWRNWILGSVAGMGLALGAFAKNVADLWRHP